MYVFICIFIFINLTSLGLQLFASPSSVCIYFPSFSQSIDSDEVHDDTAAVKNDNSTTLHHILLLLWGGPWPLKISSLIGAIELKLNNN